MLSRIPRVSYASRLLKRRYATKSSRTTTTISTVTSPSAFWTQTFKKVTAYPFIVKPRDAQVHMETVALIFNSVPLLLLFRFGAKKLGLLKLLTLYMSYKTRNDPVHVKAVYVPVWRLFGFLSFRPATNEGTLLPVEHSSTLPNVYMPGTHTPDHLSRDPEWDFSEIQELETKPIGECIKPFGMDAQCLPFTVSPLAPFDLAKTMKKPVPLHIEGDPVQVLPPTVYPEFFAAFPVMVPVYTGEYPDVKYTATKTFVVEAFDPKPRVTNLARTQPVQDDPEGEIKIIWRRTLSYHIKKLAAMPPLQNDDDPCIRQLKVEELDSLLRLHTVRQGLRKWLDIDTTNWPQNRVKEYKEETITRRHRYLMYFPSWWLESKFCPESVKEARAEAEGKPKEKPKRPAKSRSRPI